MVDILVESIDLLPDPVLEQSVPNNMVVEVSERHKTFIIVITVYKPMPLTPFGAASILAYFFANYEIVAGKSIHL